MVIKDGDTTIVCDIDQPTTGGVDVTVTGGTGNGGGSGTGGNGGNGGGGVTITDNSPLIPVGVTFDCIIKAKPGENSQFLYPFVSVTPVVAPYYVHNGCGTISNGGYYDFDGNGLQDSYKVDVINPSDEGNLVYWLGISPYSSNGVIGHFVKQIMPGENFYRLTLIGVDQPW